MKSSVVRQPQVMLLALALIAAACGNDPGGMPDPDGPDAGVTELDPADDGCPSIFYQGELPEYRVTLSGSEWDQLNHEFLNRAENEAMGLDYNPYHPAKVEYNGQEIPNSMIRLKGQSSWWQAIMYDEDPKMQFVISFNQVDEDGRFHGVRKVELDMPRHDNTFLRQRMALYYFRSAGVTAQCANNARLFMNGDYYGLYTHLERLDKEFLQRHYGNFDEGDLWKGGRNIATNEDSFSWDNLTLFWDDDLPLSELGVIADLETSVRVWAHEALPPHGDGVYNGRANYFLYDHPANGFTWIPHDLDSAFDYLPATHSPMYPNCDGRLANDRQHWALVMNDPAWVEAYRGYLAEARASFDPALMERKIDEFAAQIQASAEDDPMRPFPVESHYSQLDDLSAYPRARAATLDRWLQCWESGGEDVDGDGFEFCNDCDDGDVSRNPAALETCNGLDDDCDSAIDEALACDPMMP